MNASLLEMLGRELSGQQVQQLGQAIGADADTTSKAISAALPMLMGALAKNAARPDGAASLAGALERDHDGSLLDNLGGFLGQASTGPGNDILRHVLGSQRPVAEEGVRQASGLDMSAVAKLLPLLAPIVLAALGRTQRQEGLDIGSLAQLLQKEKQVARRAAPSGAGGLLSQFLDGDGDGEIGDDVARMGADLLGKWLKGR